jgi:hypothetical protein
MIPYLVDGVVYILQCVDVTILFMEHDLEKARNLKFVLSPFRRLSELKINFHKSELSCFGEAQYEVTHELFGCMHDQIPLSIWEF